MSAIAPPDRSGTGERHLRTTLGPRDAVELGTILPHEHLLAHFGDGAEAIARGAHADELLGGIELSLRTAMRAGVGAIVDATAVGGGRRADILSAASASTGMPLLLATGVFREPYITERAAVGEQALRDWMLSELEDGVDGTGVQAGWIKVRSGDTGLSEAQRTLLRAAGSAASAVNATVGSHTVRGAVAREQVRILESVGCPPDRFIWIHAQDEPDLAIHLELARRGVWLEYDGIGSEQPDEFYVRLVVHLLAAGHGDQLLLSHDSRGFDPGAPPGGGPPVFTYLVERFLPALRDAGVTEREVTGLTHDNPFRAYAR